MFLFTMHPHVSGHRSRIIALELLLAHIRTMAAGTVWYGTLMKFSNSVSNK